MSDAFKNYSNLISSLASSRDELANTNLTYHQTKAGIDSMGKILGETKIFLSGKPAMAKIGNKILKPLYNKYGKQYVNKLKQKLGGGTGDDDTTTTTGTPEGQNNVSTENSNTEYDDWDKPQDYNEDYDDWDGPAEEEPPAPEATAEKGFDDWDTPYEPNEAPPPYTSGDAVEASRGGTFQNPVANERANTQPNVEEDTQSGKGKRKGDDEEDDLEDLGEEGGELGGEEAGLGVLDALPFGDIIGVIGGAILSGIEAKKEKEEVADEENPLMSTTTVNTQVGLGGAMALN